MHSQVIGLKWSGVPGALALARGRGAPWAFAEEEGAMLPHENAGLKSLGRGPLPRADSPAGGRPQSGAFVRSCLALRVTSPQDSRHALETVRRWSLRCPWLPSAVGGFWPLERASLLTKHHFCPLPGVIP